MIRVSIELVPRSPVSLDADLFLLQKFATNIDVINIPDLLRFDVRAWAGAAQAKNFFPCSMPHIRAMDIDLDKELPMKNYLREHKINEVLVIQGDPPQDMGYEVYPTTTTDVIRKFRAEMPEVSVYAGIDQYRDSMRKESYRIRRKVQAGAAGFFTQPFFDMRFLEMYADMLDGLNVYWGVSPIMSHRSESYWERKNNVIFPKDFEPTLEHSIAFSRKVYEYAKEHEDNFYVMPIKTNLEEYLSGLFA